MKINNFKILFWNSNSIFKKQNELENFDSINKIDIIHLSETKLSSNSEYRLKNYHTYINDLPIKRGLDTVKLSSNIFN